MDNNLKTIRATEQLGQNKKMVIYVYTGEGAGKTTNAIGLAVRTAGQKRYAVIIQFLKWYPTGEYKIQNRLKPYYRIYQFGRKGWHGKKNLKEKDKELCEGAFEFAKNLLKKKNLDLLVLDEINLAMAWGMLETEKVVKYLKEVKLNRKNLDVVLTGRYAPKNIIEIADVVNEIKSVKEPKEMITKKGINY